MKPRLYLETTIPSYLSARPSRDLVVAGHQQITREWWDRHRDDFQIAVIVRALASICRKHGSECPVICTPEGFLGE